MTFEHFSPAKKVESAPSPEQMRVQLLPKLKAINLEELTRFGAPFVTEEDLILECAKSVCNANILSLLANTLEKNAAKRDPRHAPRNLTTEKRILLQGSIDRMLRVDDKVFFKTYSALAEKMIKDIKQRVPELTERHPIGPSKKYQEAIRVKPVESPADASQDIAA